LSIDEVKLITVHLVELHHGFQFILTYQASEGVQFIYYLELIGAIHLVDHLQEPFILSIYVIAILNYILIK
jgi:hypothetical protein